jgi:hypothetical protein
LQKYLRNFFGSLETKPICSPSFLTLDSIKIQYSLYTKIQLGTKTFILWHKRTFSMTLYPPHMSIITSMVCRKFTFQKAILFNFRVKMLKAA